MEPYRGLVIEDDPAIGQSLLDGFKQYGFQAELCKTGSSGMENVQKHLPVLCLPRSVVRAAGLNEVSLKVWTGQATETRKVTIGLRGDSNVEIVSGLKEGDQVLIQ